MKILKKKKTKQNQANRLLSPEVAMPPQFEAPWHPSPGLKQVFEVFLGLSTFFLGFSCFSYIFLGFSRALRFFFWFLASRLCKKRNTGRVEALRARPWNLRGSFFKAHNVQLYKVCFMKVFRYIKPTKKHTFGGPGLFVYFFWLETLETIIINCCIVFYSFLSMYMFGTCRAKKCDPLWIIASTTRQPTTFIWIAFCFTRAMLDLATAAGHESHEKSRQLAKLNLKT